jgi:hypothetical protein
MIDLGAVPYMLEALSAQARLAIGRCDRKDLRPNTLRSSVTCRLRVHKFF